MVMNNYSIGVGTEVTLNFSLSLGDGSIVDSNFGSKPAVFLFGDGSLLPGFEEKLVGLVAGDEKTFSISPAEGFGQPNPNNVQEMPRSQFENTLNLSEGLVLSFTDAAKAERPGVVKSISDETVIIDFNHPLAGKNIQFDVKIVAVRTVTDKVQ